MATGPHVEANRVRESEGKRVCEVRRVKTTLTHIFFLFKDNFALEVVGVRRPDELCAEVGVVEDCAGLEPLAHCAPHLGAFVCKHHSQGGRSHVCRVRFPPEINIKTMNTKIAKAINDTTTHTSTINEDRVSIILCGYFRNSRSHCDNVRTT